LTANVIGNPINHTFLWEEVTNTNVSIFTVDNFNTYYINSPPVDRVIRFYIDKGTVDEQFKEITIRATPSTSVSNSSISSPLNVKKSIHPDLNSLNYFSVGAFNQNIRFNSNGSYFDNIINIEWKLPNIFSNNYTFDNSLIYREYYQNASLEIFLNGEWITVTTKNKNEPNIASNIPINELLRIKYNYKKYGHINNETYYTGYFLSLPSLSGNNLISDLHLNSSSKITNNIYRNVVSVLSLPIDQNFNDININSSSNTVNTVYRNVYNVNLVDCESTVSDISIAHPKLVKFSITRLSGTTIGG
jgi:hypothetical protein